MKDEYKIHKATEIYTRIAYAIQRFRYLDTADLTVGMTNDVYNLLMPDINFTDQNWETIFGCKIKVLPCNGLWWIVGYGGKAEESKP